MNTDEIIGRVGMIIGAVVYVTFFFEIVVGYFQPIGFWEKIVIVFIHLIGWILTSVAVTWTLLSLNWFFKYIR